MNIFFLHEDPVIAARMQHDKHVVKMTLESTQLLSTAHSLYDSDRAPYRIAHAHHPLAKWVAANTGNYDWLYRHQVALAAEYTHRYGKIHACAAHQKALRRPPAGMPRGSLVPAPPSVPEALKRGPLPWETEFESVVAQYHAYYLADKVKQSRWTGRPVPDIFKEAFQMTKSAPAAKTAPAAKSTPAAEVATEEATARPRGPKGVELTAKISMVVTDNPKRAGSKSFDRFALYKHGMTVDQALDAGIYTADLVYDTVHSFIKIEGYDPELVVKKEKPVKEAAPAPAKEPKGPAIKKAKVNTKAAEEDLE